MAQNRSSNMNPVAHQMHGRGMPIGSNVTYTMLPQPGLTVLPNQSRMPIMYSANPQVNPQHVQFLTHGQMLAMANARPQLTEEQQRLQHREHNYHMQQQRLRALSTTTVPSKVNADAMIESMFGKPTVPKQQPSLPVVQQNLIKQPTSPVAAEQIPQMASSPTVEVSSSVEPTANVTLSHSTSLNSKKNLEEMLLECSDLMKPGRAHSFPKLTAAAAILQNQAKEENRNKVTTQNKTPFGQNQHQHQHQHHTDSSSVPTSTVPFSQFKFPDWCFEESKIPDLYRQVQQLVEQNGSLDTNKLHSILVSSCLPHEVLGHIWSLVNQSTPGQLLPHELYVALTLIALAQNGYKFSNLEIIQNVPRPLVPYLKLLMLTSPTAESERTDSEGLAADRANPSNPAGDAQHQVEEFTDFLGFTPSVQKPMIGNSTVGSRLANYSVGLPTSSSYQSPETAAINSSPTEDFADFQKASGDGPGVGNTNVTLSEQSSSLGLRETKDSNTANDNGGTGTEDKYSIFRELDRQRHKSESDDGEDEFGEFLGGSIIPSSVPDETEHKPPTLLALSSVNELVDLQKNNNVTSIQQRPTSSFTLKPLGEKSVDSLIQTSLTEFQLTKQAPSPVDDSEFGDFMSPGDVAVDGNSLSLSISNNNSQVGSRDPGSAESQSVSSLELGPVECGPVSGGGDDSGVLIRQGSLHSLNFKSTVPENEDDGNEFGDLHSGTTIGVAIDHKEFGGQSTNTLNSRDFLLDDPYRFVRDEDRNVCSDVESNAYEWERCLNSCFQLIQGSVVILNDITSASICDEVIRSAEWSDYFKNVVEIYRVATRVKLSIMVSGLANESLNKLLTDIELTWTNLSSYVSGSSVLPDFDSLDFSNGILKPDSENNAQACGVCLLDVNVCTEADKERCNSPSPHRLEYSGRLYHSTCANFWVNCVNSLLPALTLQQQLLY